MASYAVAADEVAAWSKSLGAGVVDTVTFTRSERGHGRGSGLGAVRVHLDSGTTAIHFTVDGSTPTVGGAKTYRVRGTVGDYAEVALPGHSSVVKLISSGAVTYSVEGTL